MISPQLEEPRPADVLYIELPGGVRGELARIDGQSAPVGYSEFGRAFARWSLEAEEPCTEHPPGVEKAAFLRKRTYSGTADDLTDAEAKSWAEAIIGGWRAAGAKLVWRRERMPRKPKRGFKGKLPDGSRYLLRRAPGYPTWIGETLEGRVDHAQWWVRLNGWPVQRKPSTEPGIPTVGICLYATTEALSAAEAEEWARRTAAEDRPLTSDGP
jgi:hypothetical protein